VPGAAMVRTTTKPATASAATRYDDEIKRSAVQHGVSADLVRAVIQAESAFNPWAVSPKGAMGLMQLMPATARELGVRNPFQPAENIRGGVQYLARLLNRFEQNVELALAAYNAGPGNVERYGAVPPFRETRNYVKRITGAAGTAAAAKPVPAPVVMYKWTEIVNGKAIPRYSNSVPAGVSYEIMSSR
jgi:soluble lytic murein transglycosylase-like protein